MEIGIVWEAKGTLELYEGMGEELHFLRPAEIISADYVPFVDLTVGKGRAVAKL